MAGPYPDKLSAAEVATHFPASRGRIAENTFELGLTLGGTVSAGAYTGGVLDFLIEALDAWTRAKEAATDPNVPTHNVVISTIAGASGGAINGGILLRAAGWSFPHGMSDANPFFTAWTQGVDLQKLLATGPEKGDPALMSVLHCGAIDAQANATIAFTGDPLGQNASPAKRSWLADPLRLVMMVGNITGVPYRIAMSGDTTMAHDLSAHVDNVRFALTVEGGVEVEPRQRNDEFALASQSPENWTQLRDAALATSAFPLALQSRPVQRPLSYLGYRFIAVPGEATLPPTPYQLIPRWDAYGGTLPAGLTTSINVDGGTLNNEPLDITRLALSGYARSNPRSGADADRAVLLIDPFSDPETPGPQTVPPLLKAIGPVINELVQQARFKPEDIVLAQDEDVFSRFLIAPARGDGTRRIEGMRAIASGGMGGFLGFIDPAFLRFDYQLGRHNAYRFLLNHFAFPADNVIVKTWTDAQRAAQCVEDNGKKFYRMIPLMPEILAHPPEEPKPWPALTAFPPWLSKSVEARLDQVKDKLVASLGANWLARQAIAAAWGLFARGALRDAILAAVRSSLEKHQLLPPAKPSGG